MTLARARGKFIVLGVSGSIAAYKAVELARHLTQAGARVQVVMTRGAGEFVRPLTFQSVTHRPVEDQMFSQLDERAAAHLALGQRADVVVIAPATAHTIARLASGFADDLLSSTVLATRGPVVIAPAMETGMWTNPITAENVAALRRRGMHVVDPEMGELASGQVGAGRLAALEKIEEAIGQVLSSGPLSGRRIVVTAGPTIEAIDPVRVLSNRSSGKMGYSVAEAASAAGAAVILISGPTALAVPPGVEFVPIESATQLRDAVLAVLPGVDAVVMAAAVADYRPAQPSDTKLKRREAGAELTLKLSENPDVLKAVSGARRPGCLIVGFKAETGDPVPEATRMLKEKGLDLVVANDVSAPGAEFGSDTNLVTFVSVAGNQSLPLLPKTEVARQLIDLIAQRLGPKVGK